PVVLPSTSDQPLRGPLPSLESHPAYLLTHDWIRGTNIIRDVPRRRLRRRAPVASLRPSLCAPLRSALRCVLRFALVAQCVTASRSLPVSLCGYRRGKHGPFFLVAVGAV